MINFTQILLIMLLNTGYSWFFQQSDQQSKDREYAYPVRQADSPPAINAVWNKKFWNRADKTSLKNYMGDYPSHFPKTQVRVKYDENYIYVIFRVKDNYVRAVATKTNGPVFQDSCVEFFFTPGPDVSRGYFNLETNCKGVFLFQYKDSNDKQAFVDPDDARQIEISYSLEENVENEIAKPTTWVIEYRIPFSILSKYMEVDVPGPGIQWRANFYKCADMTSHPHWLTWAPVNFPKPSFHRPEFFGWLNFE